MAAHPTSVQCFHRKPPPSGWPDKALAKRTTGVAQHLARRSGGRTPGGRTSHAANPLDAA
eukprot:11225974-Lingulodinium_polyedra.AAC.1